MINFKVKECNTLQGGLCFQLILKTDNLTEFHANDTVNYSSSIACSENAFALIEYIFSLNRNDREYYHWGYNIHDLKDIRAIILELTTLSNMLKTSNKFEFIYKRDNLLQSANKRVMESGIIYLAWSIDEMRNELERNITQKQYRTKVTSFIDKIIDFLKECLLNKNCTGIYVIGI